MSASLSSFRQQHVEHSVSRRRQCVPARAQTRRWRYHALSVVAKHSLARTSSEQEYQLQQTDSDDLDIGSREDIWESFANNVSGEWEGVTATFTPRGEPEQLPEHYVPSAFREWGVELWDWQSQCSSTVSTDGSKQLKSTVRRLMPTVGCEADAIAFTEEQCGSSSSSSSSTLGGSTPGSTLLIAKRDGSYNTGPRLWPQDEKVTTMQIEHCLVLPQEEKSSQLRFRVKIVQNFKRAWTAGRPWRLVSIDLHKEKYDGPYTGKRELAGCGGGQPGIAQQPHLAAQMLAGSWQTCTDASTSQPDTILVDSSGGTCKHISSQSVGSEPRPLELQDDAGTGAVSASSANSDELVITTLLPLQAWSMVRLSAPGKVSEVAAGVLLPCSVEQQDQQDSTLVSARMTCSRRSYDETGADAGGAIAVLQQQQ